MQEIFIYLRNYFREWNTQVGLFTSLIVSALIITNYTTGIEHVIRSFDSPPLRLLSFFLLYAFIFSVSYGILFMFSDNTIHNKRHFVFLLLMCPLLFAAKVSFDFSSLFNYTGLSDPWIRHWKLIVNWPLKCLFILASIYAVWMASGYEKPVAGMNQNFNWKPYLLLLLCAVPLVIVAAATSDFQHTYPKVKNIAFIFPYTQYDFVSQFAYELSYATDFLTIESFFRGFLVLAFVFLIKSAKSDNEPDSK